MAIDRFIQISSPVQVNSVLLSNLMHPKPDIRCLSVCLLVFFFRNWIFALSSLMFVVLMYKYIFGKHLTIWLSVVLSNCLIHDQQNLQDTTSG
jgi:hypothetical protein